MTATLIWADDQPAARFESTDDLMARIEGLAKLGDNKPSIVTVRAHNSEVTVGIGMGGSFVQIADLSGNPPYHVTRGDDRAEGSADFYLRGAHHTDIPRRFLIPWSMAERAIRDFLKSGQRSTGCSWTEV